jgi:uncharacterized protein
MKVSRYNNFFEADDGTKLAYNCMTGGLATLTEQKYRQVKEILADPKKYKFNTKAKKELREKLLKGGFLIEDEVDEMNILKVRNRSSRFDPNHLKLTILPTLNCNFRCVYCYEARKDLTMSQETQKELVEFVRKKTEPVQTFTTNWYGGEPLLVFDIISYLRDEFEKICNENGCIYKPGGIITNGYLLTREVGEKLKKMGIETAQVTLDGPKDVHDQRRPLAGGKGTFDRIMDNLSQVADLLKFVSIRVNTDKTNAHRAAEVLDAIEEHGLKGKVSVYFAKVMAHTDACANIAGSCLKDQEYSDWVVQLTKLGLEKGFNLTKYPRVKFSYCEADQINSFVIGPTGYLYKCWSDPGNIDEAVGHISNPEIYAKKKKNVYKWLAWDVFEREECLKCDVLPICMGGCPFVGLKMSSKTKGMCEEWRHNLVDMLKLYYTQICMRSKKLNKDTKSKRGGEKDELSYRTIP